MEEQKIETVESSKPRVHRGWPKGKPRKPRVIGKTEIEELIDLGEDVVLSGFDEAEIDVLLLHDESFVSSENDLPPLDCNAISVDGDGR